MSHWLDRRDDRLRGVDASPGRSDGRRRVSVGVFNVVRGARSFVLYVLATEHALFPANRESVYDDLPSLPLALRRGSGHHSRGESCAVSIDGAARARMFARVGRDVQLVVEDECHRPHDQRRVSDLATATRRRDLGASSHPTWPHSLGTLCAARSCGAPTSARVSLDLFSSPGHPRDWPRPLLDRLRVTSEVGLGGRDARFGVHVELVHLDHCCGPHRRRAEEGPDPIRSRERGHRRDHRYPTCDYHLRTGTQVVRNRFRIGCAKGIRGRDVDERNWTRSPSVAHPRADPAGGVRVPLGPVGEETTWRRALGRRAPPFAHRDGVGVPTRIRK